MARKQQDHAPDFTLSLLYTDVYRLQISANLTGLAESLKQRCRSALS